jgi:hypothetical protein
MKTDISKDFSNEVFSYLGRQKTRLKSLFSQKPRDPSPLQCQDSGTPHYYNTDFQKFNADLHY